MQVKTVKIPTVIVFFRAVIITGVEKKAIYWLRDKFPSLDIRLILSIFPIGYTTKVIPK